MKVKMVRMTRGKSKGQSLRFPESGLVPDQTIGI
jgi:hypothetical protein